MTGEDEARVAALEQKVEALKTAVDRVLDCLTAPASDRVAESFRAFQQRADKEMEAR
jgi:hypothetical protein